MGCSCTAKMIETYVEPFVYFVVQLEILVTNLLWRKTFFKGLCLGSRSVLVSTTNVQRVVISFL